MCPVLVEEPGSVPGSNKGRDITSLLKKYSLGWILRY